MPRYFAILLRSREFAKAHGVQLTWCYAQDTPMHPDDRELKALEKKRIAWLQRHGQATCHLTSLLPLVVVLPVRTTDNEDRDRQLYRGRGGEIHGWTEHPDAIKIETSDGEWLMSLLPFRDLRLLCRCNLDHRQFAQRSVSTCAQAQNVDRQQIYGTSSSKKKFHIDSRFWFNSAHGSGCLIGCGVC